MKISKTTAYALHALMYMVKHLTQLPATTNTIAKAEGISPGYLAKIFQKLVKAGLIKAVRSRNKGYVFVKPPEEINLLEIFELMEGESLFDDCLLRYCDCGGTPENCNIFGQWVSATKKIRKLFAETSLVAAAWDHPEHRFAELPESPVYKNKQAKGKKKKAAKAKPKVKTRPGKI